MDVNNQQFSAEQCRQKGPAARQALGKLLTEEKSTLKTKLLAGITKPISELATDIFHPLYRNADNRVQRNMRLVAAKWVYPSCCMGIDLDNLLTTIFRGLCLMSLRSKVGHQSESTSGVVHSLVWVRSFQMTPLTNLLSTYSSDVLYN